MREQLSTAEARLARIAERQHGVVTHEQLAAVGIDKSGVTRRVRAGRLHRVHRGVYAVGHRSLSWRGRWLAAVLAAGDGAALSHASAVALWEFLRPIQGPAHVTVDAAVRRKQGPGIVVHRSRTLTARDITRRHGIAVTTPSRTIEDVRGAIDPYLFRRALRQAELAGHRVPHLSAVKRTRSDLEMFFLTFCERYGLPLRLAPGQLLFEFLPQSAPCRAAGARLWRSNRRVRQGRRPEGVAAPRRAVEDAAGRGEGQPERANGARHGAN